jgi:transcriptional regulator with XRE-family HTH domain
MKGKDARIRFVDSHLSKGIAFQTQALRDKKEWSQQQLADKLGSNQNAVYRLENPNYGKQTLTTLKKVAAVFDVALVVRFVPFSQLVDWVSGTPRVDPGLGLSTLDVPSFQSELERGALDEPSVHKSTEDEQLDTALAKKISGEDAIQDRTEDAPNPVIERASTRQGEEARFTFIALVTNLNPGGFPYHGDFSRRARQSNRFDESPRVGPTR